MPKAIDTNLVPRTQWISLRYQIFLRLLKHPEKRLKAAYEDYEKERLPELKKENPNMRLSQLRQMLWKEWQKSPKNPLNVQLANM